MKYPIIILISICFIACNTNDNKTLVVTEFPENISIDGTVKKIPVSIMLPRSMFITGERLTVYKERDQYLFDIFHLPDCSYQFSAGIKGQGPDDFILLDTRSFRQSKNGFQVLDAAANKYKTVDIKDDSISVIKSEKVLIGGKSNNGFYLLDDSIYLTFGGIMDQNEYCLYNKMDNSVNKRGTYPNWIKPKPKDQSQQFMNYIKTCVVHPDGKKFMAFYGRFKRIRIYDSKVKLLKEIDVKIKPFNNSESENTNNQFEYYIGTPMAIGDNVYVLCSNTNVMKPNNAHFSEIQVWDWEGNPIACYKLDRKISMFALSEKFDKIFALNRLNDDELYIYDISSYIKNHGSYEK